MTDHDLTEMISHLSWVADGPKLCDLSHDPKIPTQLQHAQAIRARTVAIFWRDILATMQQRNKEMARALVEEANSIDRALSWALREPSAKDEESVHFWLYDRVMRRYHQGRSVLREE